MRLVSFQGQIQHQDDNVLQQGGQQVSVFEVLNQKLLQYGVPRLNLGGWTVEPIALVGFVLAALLLGVRGVLFGLILFALVKFSQGGRQAFSGQRTPQTPNARPSARPNTGNSWGTGRRLTD